MPKSGKFRVVAVLGSVAALGGGGTAIAQSGRDGATAHAGRNLTPPPPGVRTALEQVFGALATQAPAIAKPILDGGVSANTITQAQEDRFLARLAHRPRGATRPRPGLRRPLRRGPGGLAATPAQRALFASVFKAIRDAVPGIAKPVLDQARNANTITQAQEDQLLARISQGPRRFGPGGHRPAGPLA